MKIEYIYEYDDYLAIYEARRKITKNAFWKIGFIYLIIAVNVFIGLYFLYGMVALGEPVEWFKFLNLVLALILILKYSIFQNWWRKKQAMNQNLLGRAISIDFASDGITAHSENFDNKISWAGFEVMVETPMHFVMFVSRLNALSIPKKAFKNDEQIEEFRKLISSNYSGEMQ